MSDLDQQPGGSAASPRGDSGGDELGTIVAELKQILVEVIGEDFLLEVEVTRATTFSHDLELESIEFVAVAEKLQQRYGGRVDLTGFLAGLSIDQILDLTVGALAAHVAGSLTQPVADERTA